MKNQKGFTIIELLIVIVIIALLVAIAWPFYRQAQAQAQEVAFDTARRNLHQAAEIHLINGGGDAIWSAFGGTKAGQATAAHETWMDVLPAWPDNPLQTGDFVVEIKAGAITVSPER